jgi:hypothetical protein
MPKSLANHEIVTLAVFLLGGESSHVDTEDVAMRASEMAPGRFAWHKYPEQINIDTVRKRLWDATRADKGGYLVGSERKGWMLTQSGLRFARAHARDLDRAGLSRKSLSQREQRWHTRERARLQTEPAFLKHSSGRVEEISEREAESFFRVDDYVVGETRQSKIQRIANAFGDDPDLGAAVRLLSSMVPNK